MIEPRSRLRIRLPAPFGAVHTARMVPLSVLDLSPIIQGGDAGMALRNSLDLARHVEALGYVRYWMAEHHNLPGIASSATAVALAHIGAGTRSIRLGAGGIMLPNHAPLLIAEQFGTLAALHPGRIDLGLGRAPGSDGVTARAMRRTLNAAGEDFPSDVVELISYFLPALPDQPVTAIPGAGLDVPVWILGSSTYGAQLAAILGLPFGFASHFAPAMMMEAIAIYRQRFRPSGRIAEPYVLLGVNVIAADTDEEARYLFSSIQQSFVNIRTGHPTPLPPPVAGFENRLDRHARAVLADALSCAIVGSVATVRRGMADFIARTGANELMVTANIHDHEKRKASFALVAAAHGGLTPPS
jgi:luciferase family oxidoreductase group 1